MKISNVREMLKKIFSDCSSDEYSEIWRLFALHLPSHTYTEVIEFMNNFNYLFNELSVIADSFRYNNIEESMSDADREMMAKDFAELTECIAKFPAHVEEHLGAKIETEWSDDPHPDRHIEMPREPSKLDGLF